MKKQILIVDDDEGILEALRLMLEISGYDVDTSSTGKKLYDLGPGKKPSLIILDVLLSGADGRTLCKMLKGKDDTRDIPVIMLSAAANIQQTLRSVKPDGFMAKPFDMNELLEMIERLTS